MQISVYFIYTTWGINIEDSMDREQIFVVTFTQMIA